MSDIILKGKDLCKTFADGKIYVEVFDKVNIEIHRGEMVAILGTSGEGKSTLLHILGGLDRPTSGIVEVCDTNLTNLNATQQGILRNKYLGFVYQFHHLLPEFNVLENVCMPILIRGLTLKQAKPKAYELLAKVGLSHRINHRIGEISGGERQRLAIARALITEPVCVMADEPTGNLDHTTASQVFDLMLQLNDELKISFLIVTHDLNLAAKMHRRMLLQNKQLQQTK